jgi:hypothetical protein
MKKEYSIDEILNSLEGIKRALPDSLLIDKINSRINEQREIKIIPIPTAFLIAASLVLLISLNFMALSTQFSNSHNLSQSNTSLQSYYNLTNTGFNYSDQ